MKNIEEKLENMNKQLSNYNVSESFKAKLKNRLEEEYKRKNDYNIFLLSIPKKVAIALICIIIVFTTNIGAQEINDCVGDYLLNTDKRIRQAIKEEKVRKIDLPYKELNELYITIDSLVFSEENMCIVFNIKTKEKYNRAYIDNMKITKYNSEEQMINSKENCKTSFKRISKNNFLIFYQLYNIDETKIDEELKITIETIVLENNGKRKQIDVNKNFLLNMKWSGIVPDHLCYKK